MALSAEASFEVNARVQDKMHSSSIPSRNYQAILYSNFRASNTEETINGQNGLGLGFKDGQRGNRPIGVSEQLVIRCNR